MSLVNLKEMEVTQNPDVKRFEIIGITDERLHFIPTYLQSVAHSEDQTSDFHFSKLLEILFRTIAAYQLGHTYTLTEGKGTDINIWSW